MGKVKVNAVMVVVLAAVKLVLPGLRFELVRLELESGPRSGHSTNCTWLGGAKYIVCQ